MSVHLLAKKLYHYNLKNAITKYVSKLTCFVIAWMKKM